MSTFHLTIRTPEKEVFAGDVDSIAFNAEDGRVQVLAHHGNFVTTLQFSPLWIKSESQALEYIARSGMFTFDHKANSAVLLCLYADERGEISYQTTEEYLKFLLTELEKGDLSEYQVLYLKGEKLAVEKQMKVAK
ncbi:MAG: F0F1 ATP synthase subunit epsilon [Candidatus Gracilibacteria bacterium]